MSEIGEVPRVSGQETPPRWSPIKRLKELTRRGIDSLRRLTRGSISHNISEEGWDSITGKPDKKTNE